MSDDWIVVKAPSSLILAGVELPFIPIRESKRDQLSRSGEVDFEVIFEELRYFMINHGDQLQPETLDAYRTAATVYAKLAINSKANSTNLEKVVELAFKAYELTSEPSFQLLSEVCALALQDDASGLGKIDTMPTRLISAAHLFHNGKKDEAKEVLWPHLLELAEDEDIGRVVLRSFGFEDDIPESSQARVAALIACFA
ncbi:MAG: hypothetical protein CMB00_06335 [Euryarchaeota archaeon]|nr:hypothetical protein [Euryarchaeota archaeon]|tara:strand:+ start:189 stop:785 length:597 start_codon:yes stop_codon:yes gene_type:complete